MGLDQQVTHQVWPVPQVAAKVRASDGSPAICLPQPKHTPPCSPASLRGSCLSSYSTVLPTFVPRAGTRHLRAPFCGHLGRSARQLVYPPGMLRMSD